MTTAKRSRIPPFTIPATEQKTSCQSSEFGCRNCLWASCECLNMQKYSPKWVAIRRVYYPSCTAYTYYD
jgi:hypothetical protein